MPVRTDRSAARTDLAALTRIAREMYGKEAEVVDRPRAGAVGAADSGDRLVRTRGARRTSTVLGPKRVEDLVFRKRVVDAATALAASGASFSGSSSTDKVNQELWTLGYGGRMAVRKFLPDGSIGKPSRALRDLFENGSKYAFECATAMMVIYHKAILDHVGDEAFDAMFTEPRMLAFFRWDIEDDDFSDVKRLAHKPAPLHPGSHYYYANPGAPKGTPWQGENVIYLGDGKFYAHGVVGESGTYVVTEKELLDTLSALREPGSRKAPRRIPMVMHLDGLAVSKKVFPEGVPA